MHHVVKNLDLSSQGVWFPIVTSCALVLFALLMKKRYLSWKEIYLTYGVVGFVAWIADTLVGNIFDLYNSGKPDVTGLGDFLSFAFIPSSLAVIYLNFRTERNKWRLSALFCLISLVIYWVNRWVGYFKDRGWNSFYALLVFAIVYMILLPLHKRVMRYPDR
ncbi:MAG: hypothetical protein LKI80_00835 [Sporolactobacillus sp.]|jgi:predicted branched-subunit amino acid permease|nr:hypothetical protein [Sporolactobacillus sp.]